MSLNFYCEEEDNNREESIDKYKNLFINYKNNTPSLKDALIQMFESKNLDNEKINYLTGDIINKCKEKIDQNYNLIKNEYNNITKEDAYIICSYTYELKDKTYSPYSPYRILNQNLVSDNRQNGIRNISKYLYIFLKSLRKLPRYYPKNKYLYRCIACKVNITKDPDNKNIIPYINGNKKTFWGFTSTSSDAKLAFQFLNKEENVKKGTIFRLGGDIWGYNIELFNYFKEKEILLEPERKFIVEDVIPPLNDVINITCKILKTNLILNDNNEDIYNNEIEENKNNDSIINQYMIRFELEAKINSKKVYKSGLGILCNIPTKNIKALLTFNSIINIDFLNETNKIIIYNNNKEIEINMKINRYKYTHKDLNITIIEILDIDNININNFIEIDKFKKFILLNLIVK